MSAYSPLLAHLDEDGDQTCTFQWIKSRMGCAGSDGPSDPYFATFLANLIEQDGFPKPLPHAKHGGGIERGVTWRSKWLRAGVLQWLAGYLPPDAAAAIDADALRSAADDMDQAAALLGGNHLRLVASDGKRRAAGEGQGRPAARSGNAARVSRGGCRAEQQGEPA